LTGSDLGNQTNVMDSGDITSLSSPLLIENINSFRLLWAIVSFTGDRTWGRREGCLYNFECCRHRRYVV